VTAVSSLDHVNSNFVCFCETVTDGGSIVGSAVIDSFNDDVVVSMARTAASNARRDGLQCRMLTA